MRTGGGGPVVVVDDDARDLAELVSHLRPLREVIACASALDVRRMAAALGTAPCAAFVDLALGGGPDGIDVVGELRARWSRLPAIVITGGMMIHTDAVTRLGQLGQPCWFWPKVHLSPARLARFLELAGLANELGLADSADVAEAVHSRALAHGLTETERRVLVGIVRGDRVAEIAARLGIAESTVRTHIGEVRRKTGYARKHDLRSALLARARRQDRRGGGGSSGMRET